jgi:FkbM family methyltransferase
MASNQNALSRTFKTFCKRLARLLWRGIRPVAKPVMTRLRGFVLAPVEHRFNLVDQRLSPVEHRFNLVDQLCQRFATSDEKIDQRVAQLLNLMIEHDRNRGAEVETILDKLQAWFAQIQSSSQGFAIRSELALLSLQKLSRRQSAYAGPNIALCHLPGGAPLLFNAADSGVPARLLSGIDWEPENLDILLSYIRPDSVVLDVGANFGFFTVSLTRRLKSGQLHAIEPHPALCTLLRRNLLINSIETKVTLHEVAASDVSGETTIFYPEGALGSGSVHWTEGGPGQYLTVMARTLDETLPAQLSVDIIKIDVERHELAVLNGAKQLLSRSPDVIILMEKLDVADDRSEAILAILRSFDLCIYGVGSFARLIPLNDDDYKNWTGHIVSGRASAIGGLDRAQFSIYPDQLRHTGSKQLAHSLLRGGEGETLFSGPGWPINNGRWRITLEGQLSSPISIRLSEGGNISLGTVNLHPALPTADFVLSYDVDKLNLVVIATEEVEISLERITLKRL